MNFLSFGKNVQSQIDKKGRLYFSRRRAHSLRKKLLKERGYKIVTGKIKRDIKSYSSRNFGSSAYWPWLALYTEIRGEFIPGWMPDDYYTVFLLDEYCPVDARMSNYKTFDYRLFPSFSIKPIMVKISGQYYDSRKNRLNRTEAQHIINRHDEEVVIKEDSGLGGGQVKFYESKKIELRDYKNIPNLIIQPVIKQHKNLRQLNPRAVCTARVVTFLKDDGDIEIKYTVLRFGIGKSRVDNTSAGGGFCRVKKNGTLADFAYNKLGLNIGTEHPDTKTILKNIKVPNFQIMLDRCKKSHQIFPYARIIGWDVTVDENGEPVLLEWNIDPGLWKAEALYGPFWENEIQKPLL